MKNLIITLSIIALTGTVFAQNIHYGGNLSLGAGTINIGESTATLDKLVADEHCLKRFHISNDMGLSYSIGAFAEYEIHDNFSIGLSASYQGTSFDVNTIYIHDEFNREIVNAKNKLSISAISIPLYAKYKVLPEQGLYLKVGICTNMITSGKVMTEETLTTEEYDASGLLTGINSNSAVVYEAKFDSPTKINLFASFGLGIELKNHFTIGFDYNLPFTQNTFYSSNVEYTNSTDEGNIFTEKFKNEIATDNLNLGQFKFGTAMFSIGYMF
ncbi:MAG: outer membrane beta-barrel protein [Flavobacteriales bacterium]|nr:outer membrane beta-barrel protein [Flavobacteriales bacterium]